MESQPSISWTLQHRRDQRVQDCGGGAGWGIISSGLGLGWRGEWLVGEAGRSSPGPAAATPTLDTNRSTHVSRKALVYSRN